LASRSSWTAFDHRHVIVRLAKLIAQKSTGIVNDHLVEQIVKHGQPSFAIMETLQ